MVGLFRASSRSSLTSERTGRVSSSFVSLILLIVQPGNRLVTQVKRRRVICPAQCSASQLIERECAWCIQDLRVLIREIVRSPEIPGPISAVKRNQPLASTPDRASRNEPGFRRRRLLIPDQIGTSLGLFQRRSPNETDSRVAAWRQDARLSHRLRSPFLQLLHCHARRLVNVQTRVSSSNKRRARSRRKRCFCPNARARL